MWSVQPTVWPGEPVLMVLDDLEFQWKRGRLPNLLHAMELVMLVVLNAEAPVQVCSCSVVHLSVWFCSHMNYFGSTGSCGFQQETNLWMGLKIIERRYIIVPPLCVCVCV